MPRKLVALLIVVGVAFVAYPQRTTPQLIKEIDDASRLFRSPCVGIGNDLTVNSELRSFTPAEDETVEVIIGTPVIGNIVPFWGSFYDSCRFQILFLQTEINISGEIITFSFMPSSGDVGTYNNVRVYLCHTSVPYLTTVFDSNYAGNTPVQVIDEPSLSVGGPPDIWMPWNISFFYNNVDNLLLEIRWRGDNEITVPLYRAPDEPVPRRLYAPDDSASSGLLQTFSNYVRLTMVPTGVEEISTVEPSFPGSYLAQSQPNPFSSVTSIQCTFSRPVHATLKIYDVSGQLVTTLVDGEQEPGSYKAVWDGKDSLGRSVASGVYLHRLQAGTFTHTRKMVILR